MTDDDELQAASDPSTSGEDLAKLAELHPLQVVANPNVPWPVVEHLVSRAPRLVTPHGLDAFWQAAARNPALPLVLLSDPNAFCQLSMAESISVAIYKMLLEQTVQDSGTKKYSVSHFLAGTRMPPNMSFYVMPEAKSLYKSEWKRLPEELRNAVEPTVPSTTTLATRLNPVAVMVRGRFAADLLLFVDTIARVWRERFALPTRRYSSPGLLDLVRGCATYHPGV